MKQNIVEEIEQMKYLLGYQRGKVISEQTIPANIKGLQTVQDTLKGLGYTEVGTSDGKIGPKTLGAITKALTDLKGLKNKENATTSVATTATTTPVAATTATTTPVAATTATSNNSVNQISQTLSNVGLSQEQLQQVLSSIMKYGQQYDLPSILKTIPGMTDDLTKKITSRITLNNTGLPTAGTATPSSSDLSASNIKDNVIIPGQKSDYDPETGEYRGAAPAATTAQAAAPTAPQVPQNFRQKRQAIKNIKQQYRNR